jgi:hypothetical protein
MKGHRVSHRRLWSIEDATIESELDAAMVNARRNADAMKRSYAQSESTRRGKRGQQVRFVEDQPSSSTSEEALGDRESSMKGTTENLMAAHISDVEKQKSTSSSRPPNLVDAILTDMSEAFKSAFFPSPDGIFQIERMRPSSAGTKNIFLC